MLNYTYSNASTYGQSSFLNLTTHTGTRVEFISNWFDNVCLLNDNADPNDQLGFVLTRSLILSAVANDVDLANSVKFVTPTGHRAKDLEALKRDLIESAALADGKDTLMKKTRRVHVTEINDCVDNLEYKIFLANRDPGARLPASIFDKFDKTARSAWIQIPSEARKLIVASIDDSGSTNTTLSLNTRSNNTSRKAYFQAGTESNNDEHFFAAREDNEGDSATLSAIQDLLVN